MVRLSKPLGRIEDRAARFGERKLYRICWQTIFVSEIRQTVDTVRICLVGRTFLTPTGAASHAGSAKRSTPGNRRADLSAGTARFMPHTCRLQYLSGSAQLLGNRAVVLRSILLPA